ncbi:hypothetical protein BH09MYX1_BH09MYX1_65490 [soil metagenome]
MPPPSVLGSRNAMLGRMLAFRRASVVLGTYSRVQSRAGRLRVLACAWRWLPQIGGVAAATPPQGEPSLELPETSSSHFGTRFIRC